MSVLRIELLLLFWVTHTKKIAGAAMRSEKICRSVKPWQRFGDTCGTATGQRFNDGNEMALG
jgi:hypothetical protein